MKDDNRKCATCRYLEALPFSDENLCGNANSDYADCPCSENDTCSEWVGKRED